MTDEVQQLLKELSDAKLALQKQQADLVEANKLACKAIEDAKTLDKDTRENVDKALAKANETGEHVKELAQKIDALQKASSAAAAPMTLRGRIAAELAKSESYAKLVTRDARSARLMVKAITGAYAQGLKPNPTIDTLVSMERQPLRIRDLLTVIPVATDSVRYGKQVLRQNAAAVVPEGTQKPYSEYAWHDMMATVETVAHLTKVTLQALSDAPRLAAEIEAEMRYGLAVIEENEILNGDGTAGHLDGLLRNSTPYAAPAGVEGTNVITLVDKLRVAALQVHLGYAAPDAHVLNPVDVANIEMLRRDPDKTGGYLFGRPDGQTGVLTLWRIPVVETPSMTVGTFLTGAMAYSTNLYEREGTNVMISTENGLDFEMNQATMRCENRIGLAVRRPWALVSNAASLVSNAVRPGALVSNAA